MFSGPQSMYTFNWIHNTAGFFIWHSFFNHGLLWFAMKSNQQAVIPHPSHSVEVLFFVFGSHLDTNQWRDSLDVCYGCDYAWQHYTSHLIDFFIWSFFHGPVWFLQKFQPPSLPFVVTQGGLQLAHCTWQLCTQQCVFCRTFCTLSYISHIVNTTVVPAVRSFACDSFSSAVPVGSWVLATHKQNSCLILQFFPFPCSR